MLRADRTRAAEMEPAHPVGIAICILLTVAFGVGSLCASRLMNLDRVDAHHPTNLYPILHAVTPEGGK
jgi:hypothetical protein